MREKDIERIIVEGVRRLGGCAYKWVSPCRDGVPDRIVALPGGLIWFVEVKADQGRLSERQRYQLQQLESFGFSTEVVRGEVEAIQFVQKLQRLKEGRS